MLKISISKTHNNFKNGGVTLFIRIKWWIFYQPLNVEAVIRLERQDKITKEKILKN
jgi:hypothetical protein